MITKFLNNLEFTKPSTFTAKFLLYELFVCHPLSILSYAKGLKNQAMWIAGPVRCCSYQFNWSSNSAVQMAF